MGATRGHSLMVKNVRLDQSKHRHHGHYLSGLRTIVEEGQEGGQREWVNIKVQFELLLAGIILDGLMPKDTKAKISEAMNAKRI